MTSLEAHFLRTATRAVKERDDHKLAISELYLLFSHSSPGLRLALRSPDTPLRFVDVLIYGTRPVRYHFQTDGGPSAAHEQLWNYCLGPLSLVEEKSGPRCGRYHLFYEVSYPERFLKKLGE